MRRLALVPIVLVAGLLTGCSQVAQMAGDAAGVPVDEVCATFDDAYGQYESALGQGEATEEQVKSARDQLVTTLDGAADDVGGQLGDLIRSGSQQLAGIDDLQSPEAIEAVEQLKDSVSTFCG
ncbi:MULTISPECIES: hypothetical protein [unclassified Microbacterium]|uniref:hypothetical protein n=1 Tax=unclassified Microbacterium TaxID=2609290 RepID=UPI000EAA0EEF|nr:MULTISPECIES: hypothetical protein [unclassified Microbacterium]MBT2483495.1 hypothetical protein [Microbacterium sp. ISL-108]RKN66514.1 hypothetical protein D7252_02150 [Microbacterium sp. CGR2]